MIMFSSFGGDAGVDLSISSLFKWLWLKRYRLKFHLLIIICHDKYGDEEIKRSKIDMDTQ